MKAIEIFEFLRTINLQNSAVFAFTGDIDNLGLFVAANGRAKAECLVDEYNNVIEREISNFCSNHGIKLILSMSGEEVFGIGIAKESKTINQMEDFLKFQINDCLKQNASLFQDEVTISFGVVSVDLDKKESLHNIQNSKDFSDKTEHIINQFVLDIRVALTIALDRAKFSNLPCSSEESLIFYRNIVYAKMIQYKRETKHILTNISKLNDFPEISKALGKEYGVNSEHFDLLTDIINRVG